MIYIYIYVYIIFGPDGCKPSVLGSSRGFVLQFYSEPLSCLLSTSFYLHKVKPCVPDLTVDQGAWSSNGCVTCRIEETMCVFCFSKTNDG